MMRILHIPLMLILAWFSVILFSGHLREPTKKKDGNRVGLVNSTAVAPIPEPGYKIAAPLPQEERSSPASELNSGKQAPSPAAKQVPGASFRGPVQVANLIKRKNLEVVIEKYARAYGVDEDLIWAVIRQESGFNPGAVSPKGAMGLMQLMPGTASLMGVSDPFDVEQNIAGGVKYLEQCLSQFNRDVPLALAAYNAGPGNVVKYQGCPPFAETRNYVASILQAYAGEPIRADLKLDRVNYVIGDDPPAVVHPWQLPWTIPLPNWKIATPQNKLGSPHWKVAVRPF
jgi:Transglycosylase SLT domain